MTPLNDPPIAAARTGLRIGFEPHAQSSHRCRTTLVAPQHNSTPPSPTTSGRCRARFELRIDPRHGSLPPSAATDRGAGLDPHNRAPGDNTAPLVGGPTP